jgi:hypothetical protein
VGRRHADVDDRDVRDLLVDRPHELVARRRLPHDVEAGAPQQRDDPLADEQPVVGDHDAHDPGRV